MLMDNEFRVTVKNFSINDAENLIRVVIKYVDNEDIMVKYFVIRKGEGSCDIGFVTKLIFDSINASFMIYSFLKDKRLKLGNDLKQIKNQMEKNTKSINSMNHYLAIFDEFYKNISGPTVKKHKATAKILTDDFSVPIIDGEAEIKIRNHNALPSKIEAKNNMKHSMEDKEEIENLNECPECGTMNDSDAVFCKQCGVRLE